MSPIILAFSILPGIRFYFYIIKSETGFMSQNFSKDSTAKYLQPKPAIGFTKANCSFQFFQEIVSTFVKSNPEATMRKFLKGKKKIIFESIMAKFNFSNLPGNRFYLRHGNQCKAAKTLFN